MRQTVQHGLDWLEAHCHPASTDGWLLLPADHPCVEPEVVRSLLAERGRQPEYSIVIPTYRGKRGHPAWIGWRHVPAIAALPPGTGLNAYLRGQRGQTLEVAV